MPNFWLVVYILNLNFKVVTAGHVGAKWLKVTKSRKQIKVSLFHPKNEWNSQDSILSAFCSFFGRLHSVIISFWDLLTFKNHQTYDSAVRNWASTISWDMYFQIQMYIWDILQILIIFIATLNIITPVFLNTIGSTNNLID